jgi:hypothetical protein
VGGERRRNTPPVVFVVAVLALIVIGMFIAHAG